MIHQELNTVFFGGDGVLICHLHHFQAGYVQFESSGYARGTFVSFYPAGDDDR